MSDKELDIPSDDAQEFVTERQFKRARKMIRRMMYRRTLDDEGGKYGNLGFAPEGEPIIGIEGVQNLYIQIPEFYRITEEHLRKIKRMPEFESQDSVWLSEDGMRIDIQSKEFRRNEE